MIIRVHNRTDGLEISDVVLEQDYDRFMMLRGCSREDAKAFAIHLGQLITHYTAEIVMVEGIER